MKKLAMMLMLAVCSIAGLRYVNSQGHESFTASGSTSEVQEIDKLMSELYQEMDQGKVADPVSRLDAIKAKIIKSTDSLIGQMRQEGDVDSKVVDTLKMFYTLSSLREFYLNRIVRTINAAIDQTNQVSNKVNAIEARVSKNEGDLAKVAKSLKTLTKKPKAK